MDSEAVTIVISYNGAEIFTEKQALLDRRFSTSDHDVGDIGRSIVRRVVEQHYERLTYCDSVKGVFDFSLALPVN